MKKSITVLPAALILNNCFCFLKWLKKAYISLLYKKCSAEVEKNNYTKKKTLYTMYECAWLKKLAATLAFSYIWAR